MNQSESSLRTPVGTRVGDTERDDTCQELAAQFAAGRIDGTELDQRVTAAMTAQTAAELGRLVSDLPSLAPTAATPEEPVTVSRARSWLDVLCVLTILATVLVLVVLMYAIGAEQRLDLLAIAAVGGAAAGALGASVTHLAHRVLVRQHPGSPERAN